MRRQALNATTAIPSGLIDESGASLPSSRRPVTVQVRDLPLIAADALPPLPAGIEARLCQVGAPVIVLWSPAHEVAVEIALADHVADRSAIARAAAAMIAALPRERAA